MGDQFRQVFTVSKPHVSEAYLHYLISLAGGLRASITRNGNTYTATCTGTAAQLDEFKTILPANGWTILSTSARSQSAPSKPAPPVPAPTATASPIQTKKNSFAQRVGFTTTPNLKPAPGSTLVKQKKQAPASRAGSFAGRTGIAPFSPPKGRAKPGPLPAPATSRITGAVQSVASDHLALLGPGEPGMIRIGNRSFSPDAVIECQITVFARRSTTLSADQIKAKCPSGVTFVSTPRLTDRENATCKARGRVDYVAEYLRSIRALPTVFVVSPRVVVKRTPTSHR